MNPRFMTRLTAALDECAPGAPPNGVLLYRRAVPTSAREGRPPPQGDVPGLSIATNGIAVLDVRALPDGVPPAAAADAALHAARAAGVEWMAARASGDAATSLRSIGFVSGPA